MYIKYIITKILINQPFFELQTPDFALKFIWTVQPSDKVQKYKKYINIKVQNYKSTKLKSKTTQKNQKCKNGKRKRKKYKNKKRLGRQLYR